jgi:hypothetical protein
MLFDDFNRKYFRGRLRSVGLRYVNSAPERSGKYCPASRTIHISRKLTIEEIPGVLLHEMCHIGTKGHGKQWRERINQLLAMGAPVDAEDAHPHPDNYVTRKKVRQAVTYYTSIMIGAKFSQVADNVADYFAMTRKEFRDIAPWARQFWMKERKRCAESKAALELSAHYQKQMDELRRLARLKSDNA